MKYTKGYRYRLHEDYKIQTDIIGYSFENELMRLYPTGMFLIKRGFMSDGASSVVIDTKSVMKAAFVHDAIYFLLRHEVIPPEYKEVADLLYYNLCIQDGVWLWRAKYMLKGLQIGGKAATLPKNKKEILEV